MTTTLSAIAWLDDLKLPNDQLAKVLAAAREHAEQPTNTSALRLQTIPDTDDLHDALTAAELSLTTASGRQRVAIQGRVTELRRQIELAAIRDELREKRPVDCWCLGYGGRQPRYLPKPTGTYDDEAHAGVVEEIEVLREHCTCREGRARKARDDAAIAVGRADYRQRKVSRVLRESGLPSHYESYSWRDHPDRRAARKLAEWLDMTVEYPFALICGKAGRGKTSLAAGVGFELARRGESVIFRTLPDFLQLLKSGFPPDADPSENQILDTLKNVPWLIFDDLGAEKPTDYAGDRFYQIVNHRHNFGQKLGLRTLFTSNYPPAGDPTSADPELRVGLVDHLGDRLFGRIRRMSGRPIIMDGPDLRD